jgi:hypothetical protein
VAIWPVFLWRVMHEDTGRLFAIGSVVSWDVLLVDGRAEGLPDDVLIDTQVVIEERPTFARHGSLARTRQLSACWSGDEPVGSQLRIRAGLRADLFNPPFLSTVTGVVQRIQIVTRRMTADKYGMWNPSGDWQLADVRESPRWLAPIGREPAAEQDIGFLVGLDVMSHGVRPFPDRPRETTTHRLLGGPPPPQ